MDFRLMEYLLFNFRQVGSTYQQVLPGSATIMTTDPANIQAILSVSNPEWGIGMRRKVTLPLFGDGIFTQDGLEWKHSREVLRPNLVHRKYEDLEPLRGPVEDLIELLSEKTSPVIDFEPLFFRLALDVTTNFLFGESVGSLRSAQGPFECALDSALAIVSKRIRFQKLYWLVGGKEFRQACKTVHDFANRIIERRLGEKSEILEDSEVAFVRRLAMDFPDRDAIRGQVISTLLAGRDTTASLLTWTLFLLVRNPRVMQKIRGEIASINQNDHELRRTDLLSLKYLQNTLKEGESWGRQPLW